MLDPLDALDALLRAAPGVEAPDPSEVLAALLRRPEWHARAACRGQGTERYFPVQGLRPARAVATCEACPVLRECRAYALGDDDAREHGVWGGTTPAQRRELRRIA